MSIVTAEVAFVVYLLKDRYPLLLSYIDEELTSIAGCTLVKLPTTWVMRYNIQCIEASYLAATRQVTWQNVALDVLMWFSYVQSWVFYFGYRPILSRLYQTGYPKFTFDVINAT